MLVMYAIGALSMRVKSIVLLASLCAILCAASNLLFGAELPRAGFAGAVYFVMGLAWFWMLAKTNDTIFLWLLIFGAGPIAIWMTIGVLGAVVFQA